MNPFDQLFRNFESLHPEAVVQRTYARNEHIILTGQREHFVYFIESGAVRIVFTKDGSDQVIRLGYQNSIITSLPAFFDQSVSLFDIIAIRKSEVKCFYKETLLKYVNSSAELQDAYIHMLQDLVRQQIEREIDLLTPLPQDRYARVLERSPKLFQEIPAVYIANYLRMTPEHLSRIRNS